MRDEDKIKNGLPFQSLSKNWKPGSYAYYSLIQLKKVKLISMAEVNNAVFHDN